MSNNPFDRRLAKHAIGKAGRRSEKRVARELGGRLRPASGAIAGAKGDMTLGNVLMEAKSTTTASMSLKHEWLVKIAVEAREVGRTPALTVSFVTGSGQGQPFGDWVLIPMNTYRELKGED